jgi:hypothetical protein
MLPEKYRRLWRRRLSRRPLLPFLLAAFASVDVAICFVNDTLRWNDALNFGVGLIVGQVALVGAWIASRRVGIPIRFVLGLMMTSVIVLPFTVLDTSGIGTYIAFFLSYLVMTIAIAGVVELIANAKREGLRRRAEYRYTIGLLVGVMTATPLVIWAVQNGQWALMLDGGVVASLLIEAVVLMVVLTLSAFVRSSTLLALSFGAIGLGLVLYGGFYRRSDLSILSASYFLGYLCAIGSGMLVVRWRRRPTDRPRVGRVAVSLEASRESIDLSA